MPFLLRKEIKNYDPLRSSEDGSEVQERFKEAGSIKTLSLVQVIILLVVSVTFSSISAFALGSHYVSVPTRELAAPLGNINYPMLYNKTFTLPPSPESNAAWDSMFPKGVGFVKHPEIAPEFSGIAVFHELHCVNLLRVGYYAALDGTLEEMQEVHDHNKRPDPHHLRHCFDYLRQALICAADTNLEPVDLELGGVTGWRFERTCRDFEAVKSWAEKNRDWPEYPKSAGVERSRMIEE